MKNYVLKTMLTVCLLSFNLMASAEDIDLFVGAKPDATAELPNVMVIIDNAANFSASAPSTSCKMSLDGTVGGIEQCALYNVINGIATSDPKNPSVNATVSIGIMVYNANNIQDINNANCGGNNGGCLVQQLIPLTDANKTKLLAWIASWKTTGGAGSGYIKASGEATAAAMQETWAYFAGRTGLSGRSYASIKPTAGCQKNYTIFVGNSYSSSGSPGDGKGPQSTLEGTNATGAMNASPAATTSEKNQILNTLKTSCGTFTFPGSNHETGGYYADEWARYMHDQQTNITTYTIGVLGGSCQPSYAALLTSMAAYGQGKYFPTTDYNGLVLAFQSILSEVQSVNSVFAAVSLPVSVNAQGTYLNQVYVGMFRPDANALPRWAGNLKQYKIGYDNTGALVLQDSTGASAIDSSGTGFITACAKSYWTPGTTDTYWAFNPQGACQTVANSDASNYPDGNIVEKGAQGYQLRSNTNRTILTCSPVFTTCSSTPTPTNFNTSNTAITSALLNTTSADLGALINWEYGLDVTNTVVANGDENGNGITSGEMRPSVHGDVVHSRPVAINYGTDAAPQVVVFYGGNDGMLRAINGNRSTNIGSVTPGSEIWSFVAPEFYSNILRIRNNNVPISYKGSTTAGALPKPYGFDGPVSAFQGSISGSSKAFIYATLRRGGRALYAFDVTAPASPTIKWKVGCPNLINDSGCSPTTPASIADIGQTWSPPGVIKSSGYGSGASPMIIMGGGYDNCEDTDDGTVNNSCTSTAKGNEIYVLDADTGVLLTTLPTDRGVIGSVTVLPDSNGLAQYAYAADLGGNVYRITIGTAAPASWTITKIASLGCDTVTTCSANRKFMFGPDVVVDASGITYLLLGSGDREKPLGAYTATTGVQNDFFAIADKPAVATWLSSESGNCGASVICMASLTSITTTATPTTVSQKGWSLKLNSTEQVVTSAITLYGTVTFSTQMPAVSDSATCGSNLGAASVYNINYLNAAPKGAATRSQTLEGGGLPPSPVAGFVTLDNGTTVPFVIGASPTSPLQVIPPVGPPPGITGPQSKSRVYWYIQQ